ncbi:MAG: tetratricopeptide repeat protein, partial [Bacteroidota bacterium]|nr:tetratricopeptide repeat protein [Bacteroidota bacterium]
MKNLYRLLSTMFSIPVFVMVFFIISGIHSIYANDNIVDLEKSVSDMHNDTAKVNVLLTLGEHYCSIENDKALMYLQEAFTISTSKNYTIGIGKSLLWQGRVYYYKDDYPLAVKYLDKAKKVLETTDELNTLAFIYFAKAEISRIRGDFIHALEMYREAINLTEKTGNTKFRALYYSGIGRVLLDRKDTEKALGYFMETLNIQKTIGDQQGMSNTLTSIGISYEELGELDSSLTYHNLALKIRTDLKMYRLIASSEYHKSGVLIKMGKYVQAEKSLQIALKNFIKLEEKTGIIITSLRLAVARNRQEKPNAIESAEKALLMAKNIKNPNLISHAYKILSDIYFFNNNYKESYIYLEKHKALQDSLFSTEKERILAEIEEKYQSELKDNKIALLKEKSRIQEN